MIWYEHKIYTPDHYAAKLEEIRTHVRLSTRRMAMVAVGAVAMQFLVDVGCIYFL